MDIFESFLKIFQKYFIEIIILLAVIGWGLEYFKDMIIEIIKAKKEK